MLFRDHFFSYEISKIQILFSGRFILHVLHFFILFVPPSHFTLANFFQEKNWHVRDKICRGTVSYLLREQQPERLLKTVECYFNHDSPLLPVQSQFFPNNSRQFNIFTKFELIMTASMMGTWYPPSACLSSDNILANISQHACRMFLFLFQLSVTNLWA